MHYLLIAGGIYHVCWVLFDSSWPVLFGWKRTLAPLDDFHRALLYILSRLVILLYLYIATLSFLYRTELLTTGIGRSILLFIAVYWFFRGVMQIQFYGFARADRMNIRVAAISLPPPFCHLSNRTLSIFFFLVMGIGVLLYLVPAVA